MANMKDSELLNICKRESYQAASYVESEVLEEREDAMEFTEPERVRVDGVAARFGGHGQKSS